MGSNKHLIISLHGTGGDGESLFSLSRMLDSKANLVGIEGDVLENGNRRYFKRYPNGVFQLRSLAKESHHLHKTLRVIIEDYEGFDITLIAYSNGANIFLNILKEFDDLKIDHVILYHPSKVRPEVKYRKQDFKMLITYGAEDPYLKEEDFETLENDLRKASVNVSTFKHDYGHQLIEEELEESRKFLGETHEEIL